MDDENLSKLHGDHKMKLRDILSRSKKYLKKEWWRLALAILLIAVTVAIDSALPLIIKNITNDLGENIGSVVLSSLIFMAVGYFLLAFASICIGHLQSILLQKAGLNIVYQLRLEVFEHIENMSQNQFNEMPVGSLVTRVANYTAAMSNLFTDVLVNILKNSLTILVVFIFMITISRKLSLIILFFSLIAGIYSYFFGRKVHGLFHKERGQISSFNTFLSENLSGMRIIQLFNQQKRKKNEFAKKTDELMKTRYGIVMAFAFYRPILNLLQYLSVASVFGAGLFFSLTAGEIVAFYLYIGNFFEPIQSIADQINQIQRALTACERLFNLLDVKPEIVDKEDAIEMDKFEGKIEFKNVWFAYEEDKWILKDVSFTVLPKQMVAFVGATGAGKTTILSLIVRNYKIQKGQILIDGVDINDIKIKSLRKCIGQMLQDVFLFSGTIESNVSLRDDSFSKEEVIKACEYVSADTFIKKLPLQYDEEVKEGGSNFSSGQRQLLSFARTVLHKPQVLILDEATANIDTETESLIQESLKKIQNIGTMLVVAHRLSTIQHADNIIVLQNGEIIESGNHQTLLKKKGFYYKLYKLQFED